MSTERSSELAMLHRTMPVERYRSLVAHWLAGWFRRPARVELEPVPEVAPRNVVVTFGGHATVVVRYPQLAIAFDPMLGRWARGVHRAVEPGLAPHDLDDVGLVLISHRHADHLHLPTLKKLPRKTATIVVPAGGAAWVSSLGFARVIELQPGADLELRGIQVIAYATAHGEGDLARGISYVVRPNPDSALAGPSMYLCGDSGYFSGFADIGERFAPDIAMLPIGGFYPASLRDRHMSPLDALCAFEDLRARLLVPIHHGAFALSYERLEEPARWLLEPLVRQRERAVVDRHEQPRALAPRAGDRAGPPRPRAGDGAGAEPAVRRHRRAGAAPRAAPSAVARVAAPRVSRRRASPRVGACGNTPAWRPTCRS